MVAAVAEHVRDGHESPGLELLQARADVRSRDAERLGDLFGM
jgi:hypothetical protein